MNYDLKYVLLDWQTVLIDIKNLSEVLSFYSSFRYVTYLSASENRKDPSID